MPDVNVALRADSQQAAQRPRPRVAPRALHCGAGLEVLCAAADAGAHAIERD